MLDDFLGKSRGFKDLPILSIDPWSPNPHPVVKAMSYDDDPLNHSHFQGLQQSYLLLSGKLVGKVRRQRRKS